MEQHEIDNWAQLLHKGGLEGRELALTLARNMPFEQIKEHLAVNYIAGLMMANGWLMHRSSDKAFELLEDLYQRCDQEGFFLPTVDSILYEAEINFDNPTLVMSFLRGILEQNPSFNLDLRLFYAQMLLNLRQIYSVFLQASEIHRYLDAAAWQAARQAHISEEAQGVLRYARMPLLRQIPEAHFSLSGIKELEITDCPVETLPMGLLYQMQGLKRLHIQNTQIERLQIDLRRLPLLTELTFQQPNSKRLPLEIEGREQLQLLDLSRTQLRRLPMWIWDLRNLHTLRLNQMNLHKFPPAALHLPALEVLELRGAKFTELPDSLRKSKRLRRLALGDGLWDRLPDWLEELRELEEIDIEKCNFKSIPDVLARLPKLRVLNMQSNFVQRYEMGTVQILLDRLQNWHRNGMFNSAADGVFFRERFGAHPKF